MKKQKLNPGSDEAIKAGCLCPCDDNAYGKGYMGMKGVFVMQANCPLHGTDARKNLLKQKHTKICFKKRKG
jgi:hypothetical protein